MAALVRNKPRTYTCEGQIFPIYLEAIARRSHPSPLSLSTDLCIGAAAVAVTCAHTCCTTTAYGRTARARARVCVCVSQFVGRCVFCVVTCVVNTAVLFYQTCDDCCVVFFWPVFFSVLFHHPCVVGCCFVTRAKR